MFWTFNLKIAMWHIWIICTNSTIKVQLEWKNFLVWLIMRVDLLILVKIRKAKIFNRKLIIFKIVWIQVSNNLVTNYQIIMILKMLVLQKPGEMLSIKQEIYLLLYIQNLLVSYKMKIKIKFTKIIHLKKKANLLLKKQETL